MNKSIWTNGDWTIKWIDEDRIIITGKYGANCVMDGGDFDCILSALCAASQSGSVIATQDCLRKDRDGK